MTLAGFQITGPVLVLGVITGMTYGILALGLVIVYRSNRVINFAHGEIGALAASVLGLSVVRWRIPYWVAFAGALALAAGIGAAAEVAVVRRLRQAPPLMSIVASLGIAQFLLLFSFAANQSVGSSKSFPQPLGLPTFSVGALFITPAYSGMVLLTPVVLVALLAFFRYSRYGLAIRAAAANPPAARTLGVFVGRMSTMSWAMAGAMSAFAAVLIFPTRGFVTQETLGPSLLMRALVPAVIGRMSSLPVTLAAALGVGVVEQELLWNYPRGGFVEAALFVGIVVALLLQPRMSGRRAERGSGWATVSPWRPIPVAIRRIWTVGHLGWITAIVGFTAAVVAGLVFKNSVAVVLAAIVGFAIIGISLGIITGLGGQLSLGQFALAGIGAGVSYVVAGHTGNVLLGFLAAAVVAAIASAIIGLPALRVRGLMLAVTTLGFALAAQDWLFQQPWLIGQGRTATAFRLAGLNLESGRNYYLFSLIPLALTLWIARNIWVGGVGRRLRALRDNEDAARAFTVRATRTRLIAFVLSGFVAGLGGATYAQLLSAIDPKTFPVASSVDLVALTVIGGIAVFAGPVVGALYIIGIPRFLPLDSAGLAATALGWLVLILYVPGGLAQLVAPLRERLIGWLVRRAGGQPEAPPAADVMTAAAAAATDPVAAAAAAPVAQPAPPPPRPERPPAMAARPAAHEGRAAQDMLLEVTGLTIRYGGIRAVDAVTLTVARGETVGLIGPNGAGKTTLFEAISGFARPEEGRVVFAGRDVTRLAPESRGRLGLIRSFQDAGLFSTLTVAETIALAMERRSPTWTLPSIAGFRRVERRREAAARELAASMGLAAFEDTRVGELSTGTRRITELTCMVALEPTLLLLDEPSSGIAQRETEALGHLLAQVKEQLDATMVIIEHDIPLITGLANRMVALASGRVIAEGTPQQVKAHPAVIESYLGSDLASLERSGVTTAAMVGGEG